VIDGEVELELDDGEVRTIRKGDLVVQRGTVHKWTNVTPNGGVVEDILRDAGE
jgi:quercetin dioxygenase-like cupin family protein